MSAEPTGTISSAEEQRWADAVALLDGRQDVPEHRRVDHGPMRTALMIIGLMAGFAALGLALAYSSNWFEDSSSGSDSSGPLWADVVGLTLDAIGLALIVTVLVQRWRSGQRGGRLKEPISRLDWRQQRGLRREVRGSVPLQPGHLPLARSLARQMTQENRLFILYAALVTQQLGTTFLSPGRWRFGFVVVLAVLFLTATVLRLRDSRLASDFLDRHPEPEPDQADQPDQAKV